MFSGFGTTDMFIFKKNKQKPQFEFEDLFLICSLSISALTYFQLNPSVLLQEIFCLTSPQLVPNVRG